MVDDEAVKVKANAIRKAIEINAPDRGDVIDVVSKVGGLDIAALIGVYVGCAYYRVPAVIDGYISSVAALCAWFLSPLVYDFMIESHETSEPGYAAIRDVMNLKPLFIMDLRLGEGSGCPFTFFAIDCANSMMNNMYTFEQGMIAEEYVEKTSTLKFN
jgi:nicotinate-nucleotide--dimethylbenzimidazole phosphoribosyltransferase